MKKITRNLLMMTAVSFLLFSCGEDEESIFNLPPEEEGFEFDARLNTVDTLSATVFLSDIDDDTINVFMTFSSDVSMKRFYSTRDIQGQGAEDFKLGGFPGADDKADGSLDLTSDQGDGFTINLALPTADFSSLNEGTVVYSFWTTTGRGDFRDPTKRQATEPLVLTINLSGTNPAKVLKETSMVIRLEAPLGDATSSTFISTYDLSTYKISEGEELAALWDFGYYYGNTGLASFASTARYPELFTDPAGSGTLVSVNAFLDIESTEVNNAYFRLAPDGTDFSSFTTADDLAFTMDENDEERINLLEVGDVVYLLDQYGKKGVIEITALEPGFGVGDFIEFNIKVER